MGKPLIEIKRCIVCGDEYKVRTGKNHKSGKIVVRQKSSKTCSKKCSKIYDKMKKVEKEESLRAIVREYRFEDRKTLLNQIRKLILEWDVEPCCHGIQQDELLRKLKELEDGQN
jgi:hypothetical protein